MGQISTEEDIAESATNAALIDGRVSEDLREIPLVPVQLSVRRSSTRTCNVERKEAESKDRAPASRNPNTRARPLNYSDLNDVQRKATSVILRMNARIRTKEKKRRVIIVPD